MSPARKPAKAPKTTKASKAKASPKASRAARPKAAAARKGKRTLGAKTGVAVGKGKTAVQERRHCAATDPFGDPCQSAPRLPSRYCTIHSYLDR